MTRVRPAIAQVVRGAPVAAIEVRRGGDRQGGIRPGGVRPIGVQTLAAVAAALVVAHRHPERRRSSAARVLRAAEGPRKVAATLRGVSTRAAKDRGNDDPDRDPTVIARSG